MTATTCLPAPSDSMQQGVSGQRAPSQKRAGVDPDASNRAKIAQEASKAGKELMKLLEEELNIGGFRHRQIWRDGDVAVYEKHARGKESPCYETILIQSHDGAWIRGKYYPPAETYPSSSRWGELGWTFTNRDRALSKAEELRDVRSRNARKRPPAVLTHPEHQTRR